MERLNQDMINEIFKYLNPDYVIFCTFYVSKRIMEMSMRFLNSTNVDRSNKISLLKSLCRDIRDDISIEIFIGFGVNEKYIISNISKYAAKFDNIILMRYAHENGCPWDKSTCHIAALSGSLECLRYAHENGSEARIGDPCSWNELTFRNAAKAGSLECLKYLHENGSEAGIGEPCTCDQLLCSK